MIRFGLTSEQMSAGRLRLNEWLIKDHKIPRTQEDRGVSRTRSSAKLSHVEHHWFPEYQERVYDAAKSDCYALGCMLLELVSAEHPYPVINQTNVVSLIWRFRLYPKRCVKQLHHRNIAGYNLAASLMHPDPSVRPTPVHVLQNAWINEQVSRGNP